MEKAVQSAKKTLIHDHVGHCLGNSAAADGEAVRASIEELKEITKYL